MGCWSVSCGISNIAITAGQDCLLLPIKENRNSEMGGYCPATLPIFGKYNDYGGIENIIEDDNTKFIEEHFGISIDDFCTFLVDGKFTYDRSEVKPIRKKLEKNNTLDEIKNWRFMWIDGQVYNFMKVGLDKHNKGYMDYGTPEMTALLGLELVEEKNDFKNYDPKRFNKLYRKGDVELYSDGTTLLSKSGSYVYYFGKGGVNSLETYVDVPEELQKLKTMAAHEAWRYSGKRKGISSLQHVLGERYGGYDDGDLEELLEKLRSAKLLKEDANYIPPKKVIKLLHKKYLADLDRFGDRISELVSVRANLYPMSGRFAPHELYLTPQCGEYQKHQVILDEFAKINKSYIQEENYDEYE